MKTNDKLTVALAIILVIGVLVTWYSIWNSESLRVSAQEVVYAENIEYCTSVYWGNDNYLNIDCDIEQVEAYMNNK